MPFGDDIVEISYQVSVQGMESVVALTAANEEASASQQRFNAWLNSPDVPNYTNKLNTATVAQEKHNISLVQAGRELNMLRRGFMGLLLPITVDVAILAEMAKGSEVIAASMDNAGRAVVGFAANVGNSIAFAGKVWGAMSAGMSMDAARAQATQEMAATASIKTQIAQLQLQAKTQKSYGDNDAALETKQKMERLQLQEKYQGEAYDKLKVYLDKSQTAEKEAYALSELGLENHYKIAKGLQKDLVSGFQSDTGSIIGDLIAGKAKTGAQMIQMFRDTLGKAFGDAISRSLFTTMFEGGGFKGFFDNFKNILTGHSPAEKAAKDTAENTKSINDKNEKMMAILERIAQCTCSAAQAANGTDTATITPAKSGALTKIGSVLGLVGAVGSLGKLMPPGGGSAPAPGGSLGVDLPMDSYGHGFQMAPGTHASGGFVGSFPSGGEVPIMAMPGEYVVRRGPAQENKKLLESINAGGKSQAGTGGSVFVINANDAASFADMLSSPSARAQMEIQIIRAISNNGSIRDYIKNYAR